MLVALGRCFGLFSEGVNPEMRLVSAAIGASFPFSLLRTLVHAGFCMFLVP
jgi:hypothetical protein